MIVKQIQYILLLSAFSLLLPHALMQIQKVEASPLQNLIETEVRTQRPIKQPTIPVVLESIDAVTQRNLQAAGKQALDLINTQFHAHGKELRVPTEYRSIQSAIEAAKPGDSVVVQEGTYYEQLVMKDGVRLISDSSNNGDELVEVGQAILKLPRRTLRTIIDGSKSLPSHNGMLNFIEGASQKTIIDGFTIRNLPKQNHHDPGHAHAINMRGASAVIMNCYVHSNGSTGIGNHVLFKDQESPMPLRDFRWSNIRTKSSALIYNNIISNNLGLGVGCNHFSAPWVLGNEVFGNDDSEINLPPSPGIGAQHGAAPNILGNIVHNNPGGGILTKKGDPQGQYHIDKPSSPLIAQNIIYGNGGEQKPGIGNDAAGSQEHPVRILENFITKQGAVGIGLMNGGVSIVKGNSVSHTGSVGIAVNGSTVLQLNNNKVTQTGAPGIALVAGSEAYEMKQNAVSKTLGPRIIALPPPRRR